MRKSLLQRHQINSLEKLKHLYLIHTFKGTVVNQALRSLHGGSHEIRIRVPLNYVFFIPQYLPSVFRRGSWVISSIVVEKIKSHNNTTKQW